MLQSSFVVICVALLGRFVAGQIYFSLNDTTLLGNQRINYPRSYSVTTMPERTVEMLEGISRRDANALELESRDNDWVSQSYEAYYRN